MKKKIATLLVLVLTLFVGVFSFAACDGEEKIDDFEKYDMAKFIEEYTFTRVQIERLINGSYYNYSNQMLAGEQLSSWDYLMSYSDNSENTYNGIFLALQDDLKKIGRTITLDKNSIDFSGSIGKVSSRMISHQSIGKIGVEIDSAELSTHSFPFDAEEEIIVKWFGDRPSSQPVYNRVETVYTVIESLPTEIDERIYKFLIVHSKEK